MNTTSQTDSKVSESPVKYSLNDVGCYVDGARGIYAVDAIYTFAWQHGFKPAFGECFGGRNKLSDYEYAGEIEDDMNTQFGVDGAYWGRNEQGDWGLWEIDDYSQHSVN